MNTLSPISAGEIPRDLNPLQQPLEEVARLAEVANYRILDSGIDPRFERVANLAAKLLDADYVLITIAAHGRQWWKANVGLPEVFVPPKTSFARYTMRKRRPVQIADATVHPVFSKNPLVTGDTNVRAYSGCPIISENGFALGALSTFYKSRKSFSPSDQDVLHDLGCVVFDQLELHRTTLKAESISRRLVSSEELFRSTFEEAAIGIADVAVDGTWISANRYLRNLLGYSEVELKKTNFRDITHPDDLEVAEKIVPRLLSGTLKTFRLEKRYRNKSGAFVWAALSIAVKWKEDGSPEHFICTIEDISERVAAKEREALLVGELNHRIKNTIATVASVASQTARCSNSITEFRETFGDRVESISAAHKLLNNNQWEWVHIDALVQEQVTIGAPGRESRVHVSGPELRVQSQVALYLGLILHELSTNARKHGALSVETGHVELIWRLDRIGKTNWLEVCWRETGSERFSGEFTDKGFGGFLINRGLKIGLGGSARVAEHSDGFSLTFRLPLVERPEA